MTEIVRLSARGRITIPKAVRDRYGWTGGLAVEWISTPRGVLVRPAKEGTAPPHPARG